MAEITPVVETKTEDQAHIDAMIAKADAPVTPTPALDPAAAPERPAGLPEGFNSVEELAAAYAAAQKADEADAEEADEDATEADEEDIADDEIPSEDDAIEAVEEAGLDMETLGNKVINQGDIDAEDYAALEKAGIPKQMVQAFIASQQAQADAIVNDMQAEVGGKDNFDAMIEWAAENLTPGEAAAFNRVIDGNDIDAIKIAVRGLNAQFTASEGRAPNLIQGSTTKTTTSIGFKSTAEMTRAMSDPRYARDPAYRKEVEMRLAKSDIFTQR